jgi:hypothetical protein
MLADVPIGPDFGDPSTWLESPIVWIALAAIVVLLIVWSVLSWRKPRQEVARRGTQHIDLAELGTTGPPETGPILEVYHVPVRLALIVVAPRGRGRQLAVGENAAKTLDQIAHGLGAVSASHKPLLRLWPPQLSSEGFSSAFFGALKLPSEHGQGTPWIALSGPCIINGQKMLVGMALCAGEENNLSQAVLSNEFAWKDALRIKPRD